MGGTKGRKRMLTGRTWRTGPDQGEGVWSRCSFRPLCAVCQSASNAERARALKAHEPRKICPISDEHEDFSGLEPR